MVDIMEETISVADAKRRFSSLLREVRAGRSYGHDQSRQAGRADRSSRQA
jgi:hypothetical protein